MTVITAEGRDPLMLSERPALGRWNKSSFSADKGNCVEVAQVADHVLVRDSKHGDGSHVLTFTSAEWDAFLDGVRNGEFKRT